MSCSPFDLRDYFLKELPDADARQVETHVRACAACREELQRLRLTEASLLALRDEEIPQRIAFVSDKIFEPSPARRWLSAFWNSGARLGFASAAILAAAILIRPINRPASPQAIVQAPAPVVQTVSDAEVQARIDAAVKQAVAAVESRQQEQIRQAIATELQSTRQRYLMASDKFDYSQRRNNVMREAAYRMPPVSGESK